MYLILAVILALGIALRVLPERWCGTCMWFCARIQTSVTVVAKVPAEVGIGSDTRVGVRVTRKVCPHCAMFKVLSWEPVECTAKDEREAEIRYDASYPINT